jgi:glutamyl-tRNA synthetase
LARRLTEHTQRQVPPQAAQITQEKIQTLADFWPLAGFLFEGPADDPAARERVLSRDGALAALAQARAALADAPEPFDVAAVEHALRHVVEARDAKPKDVFQPVRLAIAGTTVSPGIFESVATLGRDETLRRIDALLDASGAQPPISV